MTCKDCIHWKACKALQHTWEKIEGTHYPLIAEKCKIFKDRSKFIELPFIEGDNTIMLLAVGGRGYIFGKEAFLTAEEAKQALKEREQE